MYFISSILKITALTLLLLSVVRCQRKSPISGRLARRDVNMYLANAYNDWQSFYELLKPIAVKRVSGTPEIANVREYINSKMQSYGWNVEYDTFNDKTPYGTKSFTNIIATMPIGSKLSNIDKQSSEFTRQSHNSRRVVLACHYDSKYFSNFEFIAATDSAVPCAILLDLAKFLKDFVKNQELLTLERHLQFMFFDGEEAFQQWTQTDSLYGSRHLANKLYQDYGMQAFNSIDLFVLLDLLGADATDILNYFPETSHVYKLMNTMEKELIKNNQLSSKQVRFFKDINGYNGVYAKVDDDHRPFMDKNVPVLHLIPNPFPKQWHNAADTVENLNKNNIQDLRLIMKYFVLEILNVRTYFY